MAYNNTKPANDGEACCGDGKSQTGDQIVASLFNQRSATSMLKEQIGGEPMTTEPIGLLAYANGVRESGIRRTADGQVEEIVFWEFADAEMNAVLAHYDAQVSKAGFKATKSNKPTTQSESIHRIYYMNKPDTSHVDQVLTIRLGPVQRNASKGVRTMIWLRYPAATK